jgi:hypothetical protein
MHYNRLLIAIISLFVFSPVFAQTKLSKKQLMQERIQLMQTIDSLKQLIEAQTVEATQEVEEAEKAISLLGGKLERVIEYELTDGQETISRSIVVIRKISKTPPQYPRNNSQIAKKPL